jgi:hypothetical protein
MKANSQDMKRTVQTFLVVAACTLASGAWAAEPGNDEGTTKADVARPHVNASCARVNALY